MANVVKEEYKKAALAAARNLVLHGDGEHGPLKGFYIIVCDVHEILADEREEELYTVSRHGDFQSIYDYRRYEMPITGCLDGKYKRPFLNLFLMSDNQSAVVCGQTGIVACGGFGVSNKEGGSTEGGARTKAASAIAKRLGAYVVLAGEGICRDGYHKAADVKLRVFEGNEAWHEPLYVAATKTLVPENCRLWFTSGRLNWRISNWQAVLVFSVSRDDADVLPPMNVLEEVKITIQVPNLPAYIIAKPKFHYESSTGNDEVHCRWKFEYSIFTDIFQGDDRNKPDPSSFGTVTVAIPHESCPHPIVQERCIEYHSTPGLCVPRVPEALRCVWAEKKDDMMSSSGERVDLSRKLLGEHERREVTDDFLMSLLSETVTSINIPQCGELTTNAIAAIAAGCPSLKSLNVSGNKVTNMEIEDIASMCGSLKLLDVSDCNKLSDAAFKAIATGCRSLQSLNVTRCVELTDEAICAIAAGCPDLGVLVVSGCCELTNEALKAIASRCHSLHSLDISYCEKLSNESLEAVETGCPELKKVISTLSPSATDLQHHLREDLEGISKSSACIDRLPSSEGERMSRSVRPVGQTLRDTRRSKCDHDYVRDKSDCTKIAKFDEMNQPLLRADVGEEWWQVCKKCQTSVRYSTDGAGERVQHCHCTHAYVDGFFDSKNESVAAAKNLDEDMCPRPEASVESTLWRFCWKCHSLVKHDRKACGIWRANGSKDRKHWNGRSKAIPECSMCKEVFFSSKQRHDELGDARSAQPSGEIQRRDHLSDTELIRLYRAIWDGNVPAVKASLANVEICEERAQIAVPREFQLYFPIAPIHLAALRGDCDVLHAIAAKVRDKWVKDVKGRTALHHAAAHGRAQVIKSLIQGANHRQVNEPDDKGYTALMWACAARGTGDGILRSGSTYMDYCRVIICLLEAGSHTHGAKDIFKQGWPRDVVNSMMARSCSSPASSRDRGRPTMGDALARILKELDVDSDRDLASVKVDTGRSRTVEADGTVNETDWFEDSPHESAMMELVPLSAARTRGCSEGI